MAVSEQLGALNFRPRLLGCHADMLLAPQVRKPPHPSAPIACCQILYGYIYIYVHIYIYHILHFVYHIRYITFHMLYSTYYYMGVCHNYGPRLCPLNTRYLILLRTQKGTMILTTTHIYPWCLCHVHRRPGPRIRTRDFRSTQTTLAVGAATITNIMVACF